MSRKALFANLTPPPSQAEEHEVGPAPAVSAQQPARLRARPILGSPDLAANEQTRPVGAIAQSLGEFSEKARRADEIERKLTEGQAVVDLDPSSIDPSFIADRMPITSEGLASLAERIRDHGQLNPILVRIHPERSDRYQVAFGHRRLRVAAMLGRPVRAVVRKLSDQELVIAQGQENLEREDLTYIEKALFAHKLGQHGFDRSTIMAAMSVYKSDLSNMLSVASKIPDDIVSSISAAPSIGRRGWIELAGLLKDPQILSDARRAIQAPGFEKLESDARFKRVLTAAKPDGDAKRVERWAAADGIPLATIDRDEKRVLLTIDRRQAPDFAEFVLNRLRDLFQEFKAQAKGQP